MGWDLFFEIRRVIRPTGFLGILWAIYMLYENHLREWDTTKEQRPDYEKLQELPSSMCFKLYNKKDKIFVWQKLSDSRCYEKLEASDNSPQNAMMAPNLVQHGNNTTIWPKVGSSIV